MTSSWGSPGQSGAAASTVGARVLEAEAPVRAFLSVTGSLPTFTREQVEQLMPDVDFVGALTGLGKAGVPVVRTLPADGRVRYRYPATVSAAIDWLGEDTDAQDYPRASATVDDEDDAVWDRWEQAQADGDEAVEAFLLRDGFRMAWLGRHDRLIDDLVDRPVRGRRLIHAVVALQRSEPHAALAHLHAPEPPAREPRLDATLEAALHTESVLTVGAGLRENIVAVLEDHRRAGPAEVDAFVMIQRGTATLVHGRPGEAESLLIQGNILAEEGRARDLNLMARTRLSSVSGYFGKNNQMETRAAESLGYAADNGLLDHPYAMQAALNTSIARMMTGRTLSEDSLEMAVLRSVIVAAENDLSGVQRTDPYAAVLYQMVRARQVAVPEAEHVVALARSVAELVEADRGGAAARLLPAAIAILLDARRSLIAFDTVETAGRHYGEVPELSVCRAMLALGDGDIDAADRFVDAVRPLVRTGTDIVRTTRVRVALIEAVIAHRAGDADRVWAAMDQALELAEYEELVLPFIDHGADVTEILTAVPRGREWTRRFIDRILDALTARDRVESSQLTPAEMIVLEQLRTGLSRPVIAERLGVSVNTVRTHIRNIYRKLGVTSREEAIDTAHGRGLLTWPPTGG